jgi:toxin ParE1/3/4
MRKLIWRPEARRQYLDSLDYISIRNTAAAERLELSILDHLNLLPQHPFIGRRGRVKGTRELVVHPNYLVVYSVSKTEVWILRFFHARQQYP